MTPDWRSRRPRWESLELPADHPGFACLSCLRQALAQEAACAGAVAGGEMRDAGTATRKHRGDACERSCPPSCGWSNAALNWKTTFKPRWSKRKLLAMKELAYGASHEINNPLANISSRAQLLLRDEVDPERRRSLATINSQAFRAHEMIADMMLFAKPPALQMATINFAEYLRELVEQLGGRVAGGDSIHARVAAGRVVPAGGHRATDCRVACDLV